MRTYFLPHGMQILPGVEQDQAPKFAKLNDVMLKVQQDIKTYQPDLMVLLTPHGLSLQNDFLIYAHDRFQGFHYHIGDGSVVYGENFKHLLWQGNASLANDLLTTLQEAGLPCQHLIQGGSDYPMTLAWGEVVPLSYVPHDIPILILAIPRRRYDDMAGLRPQLQQLGKQLTTFMGTHANNPLLLVSGDMAHTHLASGPYGDHESAKPFDEAVQKWVTTGDGLEQVFSLNTTALACGMAGMGVIDSIRNGTGSVLGYEVPTYFGMMIAQWE